MRVGIFGSYNYASIGDHTILIGLLTQFRRRFPHSSFVIFAASPDSVRETLSGERDTKIVQGMLGLSTGKKAHQENAKAKSVSYRLERWIEHVALRLPKLLSVWHNFYRAIFVVVYDIFVITRFSFWSGVKKEIETLQVFVIGGGNLLMDMFPRWPIYPLMYTLIAKLSGVPVVFYAVGAGPLKTLRGRLYLRLACALSDGLTFRDEGSLEMVAEKLGVERNKMYLAADPAFCLRVGKSKSQVAERKPLRIGVTVVSFYRKGYWPSPDSTVYWRYCRVMANVLSQVQHALDAHLTFFATNVQDIVAAQDIVSLLDSSEQVEIVDQRLSVDDILSLLTEMDLVIGTRLHSLILSFVAGVPGVAFAYQPKVLAFYQRIGMEEFVIPVSPNNLEDISPEKVVHLLERIIQDKDIIRPHMQETLEQLRREAQVSMDLIDSVIARRNKGLMHHRSR